MEWKQNDFFEAKPVPPAVMDIDVSVIHLSHSKFGCFNSPVNKVLKVQVFADTGAQTCSSGIELLKLLGCSESYLVKTKHKTHGITGTPMNMLSS